MSTSTAVTAVSGEVKGVEAKKEVAATAAAAVTEAKKEEVVAAAVAVEDEEGECDCEECQGGFVEEGGWIDELGVDDHDFY